MKSPIYYQQSPCPFGTLHIYADEQHLKAVLFKPWDNISSHQLINKSNPVIEQTQQQLAEYFTGTRQEFQLPIKASGTEFQKTVWRTLCDIPFGQTWNYGQLAQAIGNKNAAALSALPMAKTLYQLSCPAIVLLESTAPSLGMREG